MIRITAKRDKFRRGGVVHTGTPTLYPEDAFTAEQLRIFKAEPMLVVEENVPREKTEKAAEPGEDMGKKTGKGK